MRTTTDTYTGKRFDWNDVQHWPAYDLDAPIRVTPKVYAELHPLRTPLALLRELNPDADVDSRLGGRGD